MKRKSEKSDKGRYRAHFVLECVIEARMAGRSPTSSKRMSAVEAAEAAAAAAAAKGSGAGRKSGSSDAIDAPPPVLTDDFLYNDLRLNRYADQPSVTSLLWVSCYRYSVLRSTD